VRTNDEPFQSSREWETLGGKVVMKGISRLVIANRVRERRTFVRCVQIENASRTKHDGIRDPVKTYLYR